MVLDASGSMRRTDPRDTRQRAAQLFAELLGPKNEVGIVSFADSPEVLTPLTRLDSPASRDHVTGSIGRVASRGQYTDITAALERALDCFDLAQSRPRCVILLTDGEIDLPGGEQAAEISRGRLLTQTVARCAQHGIPIHTITFSDAAQDDLLTQIAAATQAQHHVVNDPRRLHDVFADLFEAVDQPQMAPIEGDTVMIDASVRDATFLLSHGQGTAEPVRLTSPSGRRLSAKDASDGARWYSAPEFDLVTVESPEAGAWRIAPVSEDDRVILVTDLALETSPVARQQSVGTPLSLQAWLSESGEPLVDEEILSTVAFEMRVTDEAGHSRDYTLRDDGQHDDLDAGDNVFGALGTAAESAGTQRLTVQARGATFSRQRTFLVSAVDDWLVPALDPAVVGVGQRLIVQASLRPGAPPLTNAHLRALITDPAGQQTALPLPIVEDGLHAALFWGTSTPGTHSVRVVVEGTDANGRAASTTSLPVLFEVDPAILAPPQVPPETQVAAAPRPDRASPEPSVSPVTEPRPATPEPAVATATAFARSPRSHPALWILWSGLGVCLAAAMGAGWVMLRRRSPRQSARDRLNAAIDAIARDVEQGLQDSVSPASPEQPPAEPAPAKPETEEAASSPAEEQASEPAAAQPSSEESSASEATPAPEQTADEAGGEAGAQDNVSGRIDRLFAAAEPKRPATEPAETEKKAELAYDDVLSPEEMNALFEKATAEQLAGKQPEAKK